MIIVQGFLKVQPDDFAQYKKRIVLHNAQVQLTDGCLQYSMAEDPGVPGLIWVSERWRDREAQAAHMVSDTMGAFNQFMKHMPISAAHIASYDVDGAGRWLMRVGSDKVS
jgi:quinol monooxygenase YgiN